MWQSKKSHTSFVKSFLHHGDSEREAPKKENLPREPRSKPSQNSKRAKPRRPKGSEFMKSFFDASSLGEESVSLQVLGI